MTASFVVDASIALTWVFQDEATPQTLALLDRLQDESVLVPSLSFLEIANVLVLAERKGRIATAQSMTFLANLKALAIDVDSDSAEYAFDDLLPLCREHALTCYDAVYLELAMRRQLPLATLDDALRAAAAKVAVDLLGR